MSEERENALGWPVRVCAAALLLSSITARAADDGAALAADTAGATAAPVTDAGAADGVKTIAVSSPTNQAAAVPAAQPRSLNRIVEEVVVTAQKREENLMNVPISIAAFSSEALEARGASDPNDLKFITPGLVYDNLVGYSLIYMRGVGTEVFAPHQEPSVATYIDGVYFPFAQGLAQEFTKLERVEVLKGPQGTLFGRNATGGAINIIAKKPSDHFEASFDAGLRNFDGHVAKAYVNIPLLDSLSLSLGGLYDKDRSYYELLPTSPNQTLQPNISEGFNPRIHWQIADNLSAMLSAYVADFSGTGTVVNTNVAPKPLGMAVGVIDAGDRKASINEPETIKTSNNVLYGNVEWITDFANLKLLASNTRAKTDTRWDYDAGPLNAVFFWPTNQYFDSRTAELQAVSNANTPWAEHFEWTTGLYYYHSEAGFDPLFIGARRLEAPGPQGDVFSMLFSGLSSLGLNVPAPIGAATLILRGVIQTDALAGYAQGKWSPTDWVSLTLGGRYQSEHRKMLKSSTGVALDGTDPNADVTAINFLANRDFKADKNDFSPRIALDFTLFDNTLLYASWSQAFKSGTFNIVAVYTPPQYVKPEKTSTYELGIKGHLFDNNLRYTAALFNNKIDQLQTQVVSLLSGGVVTLANAASATIYGGEFDTTWQALPHLLPGFALTASGTYLHGRYDNFPQGPGFDEQTGLYFGPGGAQPARNFSGHETVRTPKFSGSFGLSYAFDAPGGNVEVGSDVYYNSGYFFDTQNVVSQPHYYNLNARASYLYEPWNVRVSVFGKNLTDQFYYYNIFATDFGANATAAPPATYGMNVNWTF